jgi:transcriptional regulator with XRE-family HTH domain
MAAGFDVRRRQGGRAQLAAATGLSLTTISRTLDGKTFPLASQLTKWAAVLNLDHRIMMVESGFVPEQRGPQPPRRGTNSATLSPDEAMTAWRITDPIIRRTLTGSIVHAIELQAEIDAAREPGPCRETSARGAHADDTAAAGIPWRGSPHAGGRGMN